MPRRPNQVGQTPTSPPDKRRYVRAIFSDIAPRYDLLNRVLSLNIDQSWRRRAVARLEWQRRPGGTYLDACAGTLDLAVMLAGQRGFAGRVIATDFAVPMLRLGGAKARELEVRRVAADTLSLPLPDASMDGAIVGFGVRNLADLDLGLRELARVIRAGGRLVVLDFATPAFAPLRALYLLYFRRVLPLVGRIVSGHPTAYQYLPDSVLEFPAPEVLASRLAGAGFKSCAYQLLTGGIAAVTWGER
ncbi:MAG TPA: ubiquinone/menaquinone biosynthesis methyltransferase [Gemmatimonadales bacterium]|nr:ubiquinone/menaquinone biosynthesis methyltransferase [Gemmatimonadales bacterium]